MLITNVGNTIDSTILFIAYFCIIFCAMYVITNKNPILSVLYLILLFSVVAFCLMILNITFIGLSYLLVYVGAVSILFLFILMLINVRVSELVTDNNNSVPLSLIVIIIFSLSLNMYALYNDNKIINLNLNNKYNSPSLQGEGEGLVYPVIQDIKFNNIYYATSHTWDTIITDSSQISSIGNVIYTSYPILLLIISVILLLSMIGSIVITVKQ